MATVVTNKIWT